MTACGSPTAGSRMWSRPLSAARAEQCEEVARVRLRSVLSPATQHPVVHMQQPRQPPRG